MLNCVAVLLLDEQQMRRFGIVEVDPVMSVETNAKRI